MENKESNRPKLIGKIIFRGKIKLLTGLHIGGSRSTLDIGGIDLNVIKTPKGVPYIPGSSLKGKLRSLLAKVEGSPDVEEDSDAIKEIFGAAGDDKVREGFTRLIVRDADLDTGLFKKSFEENREDMETDYTVAKFENTIDRLTGTAKHPRQIERVPANAYFNFEMVYDEYDDEKSAEHLKKIRMAMALLESDYLGGQGSRGYGKIQFVKIEQKDGKPAIVAGYEEVKRSLADFIPK